MGSKLWAWPLAMMVGAMGDRVSAEEPPTPSCPFLSSVYRDVNGGQFELTLAPPDAALSPVSSAAVTIATADGVALYRFAAVQSSGYVSYYMLTEGEALRMDFFNADLTYGGPGRAGLAPALLFVSGLGSYDYYSRRSSAGPSTAPLILDTLWQLDRCL